MLRRPVLYTQPADRHSEVEECCSRAAFVSRSASRKYDLENDKHARGGILEGTRAKVKDGVLMGLVTIWDGSSLFREGCI